MEVCKWRVVSIWTRHSLLAAFCWASAGTLAKFMMNQALSPIVLAEMRVTLRIHGIGTRCELGVGYVQFVVDPDLCQVLPQVSWVVGVGLALTVIAEKEIKSLFVGIAF